MICGYLMDGLKCRVSAFAVPTGLEPISPLHPGLTPWATIVSPFGLIFFAGFGIPIPSQFSKFEFSRGL